MAGSVWGEVFRVSTWGESHGEGVGVVVDGAPAGISLSEEDIQKCLDRRKPGETKYSTPRKEGDKVKIMSGVFEGKTTGTPISMVVVNTSQKSGDYSNIANVFRPGHADFTFDAKYGFRDYRGGGRSSGRETIGRVAAGAIAMKILSELGITVTAYTKQIGPFVCEEEKMSLENIEKSPLRMPDLEKSSLAEDYLAEKMEAHDSVGGMIECVISGMPAGIGEPVFGKLDAMLSAAIFSIGAVKGVEIGAGFAVADKCGSENNDGFYMGADGRVKKHTNFAGGILGGMSDGDDIVLRAAFKPTPSIFQPQETVNRDGENVEIERFGEPVVPDYEIPYHTEIMENFDGIDLDSARRVAGNGFYYLMGDIARLHSAVISYARDFMINRGFTYCVPPFMIRSNVVTGVMSFAEMDAMMYKIEGEDLYLIGTSEHSMIGKFIDQIVPEEELPKTLTSYSPCFRKEKGAHGLEERGVYRIHQFEKQEMIVVCKPEESPMWFEKLWQNTVDLFRSLDIPVRTLECCSGDLADLKVKSLDVEAWSPRQKKYFEVGSCSNLGDAQARRLRIRVNGKDGKKYLAHTLNNTVVAPPRMLIAFLENNLNADGSVNIPEALQPYMGGMKKIEKKTRA